MLTIHNRKFYIKKNYESQQIFTELNFTQRHNKHMQDVYFLYNILASGI